MAVDAAATRVAPVRSSFGLARIAALPAGAALALLAGASFALRVAASFAHVTPLYFPDEYIYGELARNIADSGRPLVRGASAHFPALLEPLLAAPFWIPGDAELAYRLTQGLNALAMSLAVVPVYLLSRRLGLSKGFRLGAAALAVACPDLMYASFIMSDPIAYPLVLGAVYAGLCALDRPTYRAQLAFVALAGLATFARVQYVVVPAAFVVAAAFCDRRRAPRVHALPLTLLATPIVGALALGPSRLLGYYSGIAHLNVGARSILHWGAVDLMMLAYSAGWVLVPGALVGLAAALARPRFRFERAFAALTVALAAGIFLEASLYAASGSTRYQERYLFSLLPLVAPAFGLYVARGWPRRPAVALLAAGMLAMAARVPLSGFTVAENKQDSPFLFAVFKLETYLGVANGSLLVAVLAGLFSLAAVAIARRRRGAAVALGLALVAAAAVSVAAFSFDARNSRNVRESDLPADMRWIDRSGLGSVVLVQTAGAPRGRALEQLFWNRSVDRVVLLRGAHPTDAFAAEPVRVADDGRLVVDDRPLRQPLLVENYGVRALFSGAEHVERGSTLDLWRPRGTPRLSLLASGLYFDGWLSRTGSMTVWPDATGDAVGELALELSLPAEAEPTPVRFRAPGLDRTIAIAPGERERVTFRFATRGPWKLFYSTRKQGFLQDDRAVSVRSADPELRRGRGGRAVAAGPTSCEVEPVGKLV